MSDTVSVSMKTRTVKEFWEKCPECGKEISGMTEKRVEGLLEQHVLLRHRAKEHYRSQTAP